MFLPLAALQPFCNAASGKSRQRDRARNIIPLLSPNPM
jgi:hypothetical protein